MYQTLYHDLSFAFCPSYHWTATIFSLNENYECPICPGNNIELMPLNLNEKYEYDIESDKGLEGYDKFEQFNYSLHHFHERT